MKYGVLNLFYLCLRQIRNWNGAGVRMCLMLRQLASASAPEIAILMTWQRSADAVNGGASAYFHRSRPDVQL
eukprot:4487959-Karenia_brevis.AAC.1